jgi:hypothetical protein
MNFLAATLLPLLTVLAGPPPDAVILTVVLEGDPAPDGNGTFAQFSTCPPLVNNAGQVTFYAQLNGTTGGISDSQGVFRGDGVVLDRIQRRGDLAPDGSGEIGAPSCPDAINDFGEVLFGTVLLDLGGTPVLYRADGNTLSEIVRYGEPAPSGGGNLVQLLAETLNNQGQALFSARLHNAAPENRGLYLGDGGPLTELVTFGDPAPDGNGTFEYIGTNADLNDAGQVLFMSTLDGTSGGSTDDRGLYRCESDGTLTEIARKGDPTPSGDGTLLQPGHLHLSHNGNAAFESTLQGTSGGTTDDEALYLWNGTDLDEVIRAGDSSPVVPGHFESFDGLALNDAGEVVFLSYIVDSAILGDTGIFRYGAGTGLEEVARRSSSAPFSHSEYRSFLPPEVNQAGEVSVGADLVIQGESGLKKGIALAATDEDLPVVRQGEQLEGAEVVALDIFTDVNAQVKLARRSLNDLGQVAFKATLADGRYGIFLYTLEDLIPVAAGAIPDGSDAAPPLQIDKAAGGQLSLSWSESCLPDEDYEIYEGTLGDFSSHTPRFCSTDGELTLTFDPDGASAYYLVVPRSQSREGSYGIDSDGHPRPRGRPACVAQGVGDCP